jgi:hypothetical protein
VFIAVAGLLLQQLHALLQSFRNVPPAAAAAAAAAAATTTVTVAETVCARQCVKQPAAMAVASHYLTQL